MTQGFLRSGVRGVTLALMLAASSGFSPPVPPVGGIVRVVLPSGEPAPGAAVVLTPSYLEAASGVDGIAHFTATAGDYSARASVTVNGKLFIGRLDRVTVGGATTPFSTLRLEPPPPKPQSTGEVQVSGRSLLVRGKSWHIRGVGYEPSAIGAGPGWRPSDDGPYRRDFPLLARMGCNAIRTWGEVDARLLRVAQAQPLRVIAGFWVPYELKDLGDPLTRARLLAKFRAYVSSTHRSPALLMYAVGNEQNYQNGNNPAWYSLVNELAWAAYDEEGAAYHPVTTPNGELNNIGNKALLADDESLCYLDCWAANLYPGVSFGSRFRQYTRLSRRPFWVSEYGCDAYDHREKKENESLQARYATLLWKDVHSSQYVIGSTIMSWCDQYWKSGNPSRQTPGGPVMSAAPDGIADEAYWGVMRIEKSPKGDLDTVRPRQVYFALQRLWLKMDALHGN